MNRRGFLSCWGGAAVLSTCTGQRRAGPDLVVVGGGVGGCAAALAALRLGLQVVLTEETEWIGGQLTAQAVPPDEHRWIGHAGSSASYRAFRSAVRNRYRQMPGLRTAAAATEDLNPGGCAVSTVCHEPRVALDVIEEMLVSVARGRLEVLREYRPVAADVDGDRLRALVVQHRRSGERRTLEAPYFLDATETGDLLPLAGVEYVTGAESRGETGELHAPEKADTDNMQAATWCFAIGYRAGENHTIEKPASFDTWRTYVPQLSPPWPGRLFDFTYSNPLTLEPRTLAFDPRPDAATEQLNLWIYRRLIDPSLYVGPNRPDAVTLVNWPQNDYLEGNLFGGSPETNQRHQKAAQGLSLSLLYWLQTEAPRPDGGLGWPGLVPRGDITGTPDGLAMQPYVRESRRIKAVTTVCEQHVGLEARMEATGLPADEVKAFPFPDTVGTGYYRLDLHPSTRGDNYVDIPSLRFQVPMGALLPIRVNNLLPACKNIGTTHITNGCYRLHPVEWVIGEAAGTIVSFCIDCGEPPRHVRDKPRLMADLQCLLKREGVDCYWELS